MAPIAALQIVYLYTNSLASDFGAQKRTRTSTTFRSPAPEAGASTNFAIWAFLHYRLRSSHCGQITLMTLIAKAVHA